MRARRFALLALLGLNLLLAALPLIAQTGDGDGDGVRDGLDLCPNERGPIANFGCPASRTGQTGGTPLAAGAAAGSISGRVWNDQNGDGVQSGTEAGIAGVLVELWDANRTTRLGSTRTDGAGLYTIAAPTNGNYRLRITPASGYGLSPKDAAGDAADSDFNTTGADTGFSETITLTTAATAAARLDAGLRLMLAATPTPNLFNAQAAPALTLVLAPTFTPAATAGISFDLPPTTSPDESQNAAATSFASLQGWANSNNPPTATRFPAPNMTQIAQWQTSVARQTLTARPTVTGTLSATPTPTSSLTPSVTPTGTLPTVAPTIDPRGLTALAALGTSSVLRATANASATRGAALQAANQTAIAGLLPTEAPTNPLTPDVSLLFNPPTSTKTPTPTAQLFTAQIAPAVTLIGVVIGTPTATPPPQAANPVQGGAQAAITIMPPRSSATPAAVLIQPDTAVQAINTPVAGEPVQPTPAFDRDGDLVPDALDACPDERNLTPNGCPPPNLDRDGDGTLDYADACPDQPGDITSRARDPECPDTDNDGWTDDVDECPDQPALLFGGCPAPPDRDGDGVLDSEDLCPDVRHESSSGCPDSDGDDFNDANDSCPNQAAPFSSDGCPTANDRDGDGIPNTLDRCPDSFNLTLNGCPPGVREFTPTHTPTITPASVDLTGPTPGLVFIPSPVPTTTPMPQVSSPLDGAQAAITVIAVVPSASPTDPAFNAQIAPALTLVLASSATPSPPGVIGISPTPASPRGVTPTPTMTPNLVFRPPSVRAPASLVWDPLSPGPFLSARNLSFTDPNPANSGAGLVVVLTVSDGELFTFDPVAGRLAGRRLIFDSAQELANLLAGMYYQPGAGGTNPVRIVLEAFYLRGLNDRSPTVTAVISLAVPAATPPG